jgi:hypothetical protein
MTKKKPAPKRAPKKLRLEKEPVRNLSDKELQDVAGGGTFLQGCMGTFHSPCCKQTT